MILLIFKGNSNNILGDQNLELLLVVVCYTNLKFPALQLQSVVWQDLDGVYGPLKSS